MLDEKIYGKWEYDVVAFLPQDFDVFSVEVSSRLNDRWQIHGTPFVVNDLICQVVVKFTPPEQPLPAQAPAEVPVQ